MSNAIRTSLLAACVLVMSGAFASAEPMLGYWQSRTGLVTSVAPYGSYLCITLRNKEFAGRMIGQMKPNAGEAGKYSGSVLHPGWNWTFNGYAELTGDRVRVSGCVVGRVFCRSQNWRRVSRKVLAER